MICTKNCCENQLKSCGLSAGIRHAYRHLFRRPFVKRFARCDQTVVCLSVCLSCLSVTFVHCGQTVGRITTKRGVQVGLGPGHIVLDRDPAPPPPKGQSSRFLAHICCVQMAAWIKMSLGMELGLGPGDFVLWGLRSASPKGGGGAPNFRPMFIAAKRLDG